jgi:DNA-directed RNA polymerase subunit RPC12/RpoP
MGSSYHRCDNRAVPCLVDAQALRPVGPNHGIPHHPPESFGADCCGCLVEIIGATTEYRCNECDAIIPPDEVHRVVLEIVSTDATCPHCGRVNEIAGFSEVHAFICKHCGHGAGL